MLNNTANIVEIFESVQGEGKFAGALQIFVRLSGCPLKCSYCDTDHAYRKFISINESSCQNPVTAQKLMEILNNHFDLPLVHSISFTGGEPLLYVDFLREFASYAQKEGIKLFLETSAYDIDKLMTVAPLFNIMSIDIKTEPGFEAHAEHLLEQLSQLNSNSYYLKLVLKKGDSFYCETTASLLEKHKIHEVWIQAVDNIFDAEEVKKWQKILASHGVDAYFVPQIHKLINIP